MKYFANEEPKEGAFFAVYSDLSGANFFYKDDTGIYRDPVNDMEIDDVNWFQDAGYLWFFEVDDRFIKMAEEQMTEMTKSKSDNNGWIRINSEDDLPKEYGYYWVIDDYGEIWPAWYNSIEHEFEEVPGHWSYYTHYKPIPDPGKPIF